MLIVNVICSCISGTSKEIIYFVSLLQLAFISEEELCKSEFKGVQLNIFRSLHLSRLSRLLFVIGGDKWVFLGAQLVSK